MNKFIPYSYQKFFIQQMIYKPYVGGFLDMGLGKTVCTLSALQDLKYNRLAICKALVIAPKKVAEGTWSNEAQKWEHLQNMRVSVVLGTEAQRIAALNAVADVYVINRENTQWLVEYLGRKWCFDTVVLDESSSFKNARSKRFRALKSVRSRINRLILLTGTPSPKSLEDLWAQIFLLDGGARLGRTLSTYREMFFTAGRRNRNIIFEYVLKDGAEQEIYRRISDICVSMKSEDYLDLPDMVIDDIPVVLDKKARKAYDDLEKTMLLEVGEDEEITATTAAALTGKLLQLCNGAVYNEDGDVKEIHDCKIEALMETLEQLGDEHALIYYHFKHDLERILAALGKTGARVRVYKDSEDMDAWNAGKVDYLLAQPASCGYGLNLQAGGHHVIWFGLTWNLEEYQQANKRLHRLGQTQPVIIHRLVVQHSTDADVVRSLEAKDKTQEELLQALKARIQRAKDSRKDETAKRRTA